VQHDSQVIDESQMAADNVSPVNIMKQMPIGYPHGDFHMHHSMTRPPFPYYGPPMYPPGFNPYYPPPPHSYLPQYPHQMPYYPPYPFPYPGPLRAD